jgi:hypothetical protein
MQFDLPDMCSYDLGTYFYDDNYGADGNPGYSSFSCGWGKWPYISEKNFYTRNLSEIPIVAIRKDNSSQYYGFTYSNRSQRSYITCSSVFNKDVKSIDVYQGDIYICMFEYLHSSCPTMTAGGAQNWHASPGFGVGGSYIIFPIESTLNLNMLTSNQLFSSDKNPDK